MGKTILNGKDGTMLKPLSTTCFWLYFTLLSAVAFGLISMGNVAMAATIAAHVEKPQRAIPEDNLAYPVLITEKNPQGAIVCRASGFYLDAGKAIFLVTAKHVLFNPNNHALRASEIELLSYSRNPGDFTHPDVFTLNMAVLQKDGNIRAHPSKDVAVIKIFVLHNVKRIYKTNAGHAFPVPGVMVREFAKDGILDVSASGVTRFAHVLTGNSVMVFGFPSSLDLKALSQLDSNVPLLRKGIIAGVNPEKRTIILDCPVYPGNSGGPVLEIDRGAFKTHLTVIGVISQYVPYITTGGSPTLVTQTRNNSGYSIAIPMDFVLDLTK